MRYPRYNCHLIRCHQYGFKISTNGHLKSVNSKTFAEGGNCGETKDTKVLKVNYSQQNNKVTKT